jgi:quercetin dioxygenase-like cupin family protein
MLAEIREQEEPTEQERSLTRQVKRMAELIDYQEGSVVSRQIMKGDGGNVTLFAFEEGEGLTEHTSPFDALVLVLDGEAEVTVSGKPSRLHEGDMILMPANAPHALKAPSRFKMLLIMIK